MGRRELRYANSRYMNLKGIPEQPESEMERSRWMASTSLHSLPSELMVMVAANLDISSYLAILVFIIAVRLRGIGLSSKAEEFFQLFLNYPIFDFDSPLKIVILQLVVESRSFFSRSALSQPDS